MIIFNGRTPVDCIQSDFIGITGDNLAYTQDFYIKGMSDEEMSYTIHLKFTDGSVNSVIPDSVTVDEEGTAISWVVKENDIFKHGYFDAQIEGRRADGLVWQTESFLLYSGRSLPVEESAFNNPNSETQKLRQQAYEFLTQLKDYDLSMKADKSELPVNESGYVDTENIENEAVTAEELANGAVARYHLSSDLQTLIDGKADKSATLSGYGIEDAYTKSETQSAYGLNYTIGINSSYIPIKVNWDNEIPSGAFASDEITIVYVSPNVTKIKSGAFTGCQNLKQIYIINSSGNVELESGAYNTGVNVGYASKYDYLKHVAVALRNLNTLKANKANSLSGYGITNAYTKAETNEAILNSKSDVLGTGGIIGTASSYSGDGLFASLDPHKSYLIWGTAWSAFTDVSDEVKSAIGSGYAYVFPAAWSSAASYASQGGYDLRVHIEAGSPRRLILCHWSGGTLNLEGVVPFAADLQSANEKISDLESRLDSAGDATASLQSERVLRSPSCKGYVLQIGENNSLITIPTIPNKALFIGNSLLLGFPSFGASASDNEHDYFYYVKQTNPDGVFKCLNGSGYEACTSVEEAQEWINENLLPQLDSQLDLVHIQLGDNVSNDIKKSILSETSLLLLQTVKQYAPNARIAWTGCWYQKENVDKIKASCEKTAARFIDICDIKGDAGLGLIYTCPYETTCTYTVDSFSVDESAKSITINFTVDTKQYSATISYESYTSISNTEVTVTGLQRVIVNKAAASHPGDEAFKQIADRIIDELDMA